ncbi:MAG TPA: hypothetical protein VLQ91_12170 [Draconibacterium sp.]|nr:hypothetical protein [Draconibacterium sp.]
MKLSGSQILSILIVAMSFGTAWAVRGQFGHEQGAAWAAGIGGLSLVLVSQRKDWYQRVLSVTLASAVGWGMGGMISYGQVVGYGRSDDFANAAYGLLMLFVIGGLFGLIGGGLTGLTLESSGEKRVKWAQLMAEMVAGGLIAYGLLVMQLEILMTPPRSEAWAFCFGAGLALVWYMARNGFQSSLKVSLFTMTGAGFGFAFGNFLQIVGNLLEINFNMWNVMEYSIGFFGGLALAYSVFTSPWPQNIENPKPWENRVSYIIALIIIPIIVFQQSMSIKVLFERLGNSGIGEKTALLSSIITGLLICLAIVFYVVKFEKAKFSFTKNTVFFTYLTFISVYVAISFIVSGIFAGNVPFNHVLYVVNIGVVLVLLRRIQTPFSSELNSGIKRKYIQVMAMIIIVIVLLAILLVNIHGGLGGSQTRFGLK